MPLDQRPAESADARRHPRAPRAREKQAEYARDARRESQRFFQPRPVGLTRGCRSSADQEEIPRQSIWVPERANQERRVETSVVSIQQPDDA